MQPSYNNYGVIFLLYNYITVGRIYTLIAKNVITNSVITSHILNYNSVFKNNFIQISHVTYPHSFL